MSEMRESKKKRREKMRKRERKRKFGERMFSVERKTAVRSLLSPFPHARTENGRLIWRFHE